MERVRPSVGPFSFSRHTHISQEDVREKSEEEKRAQPLVESSHFSYLESAERKRGAQIERGEKLISDWNSKKEKRFSFFLSSMMRCIGLASLAAVLLCVAAMATAPANAFASKRSSHEGMALLYSIFLRVYA